MDYPGGKGDRVVLQGKSRPELVKKFFLQGRKIFLDRTFGDLIPLYFLTPLVQSRISQKWYTFTSLFDPRVVRSPSCSNICPGGPRTQSADTSLGLGHWNSFTVLKIHGVRGIDPFDITSTFVYQRRVSWTRRE